LKQALLKRYQLTEEGFRKKFRTSLPEKGENASEFAVRLDRYLSRWTELAEIEISFQGLKDLLKEQFITIF